MSLVVGKSYKIINGDHLGKYIEHKLDGFSYGGAEYYYVFENQKIYDDGKVLEKIELVNEGGGKMRSRKARRKRRRTLKKHKKTRTKSRK